MNEYENLANAIILQAVSDYRSCLQALKINKGNRDARYTKRECENFFRSEWYGILTDVDGELLINKLKAEAAA